MADEELVKRLRGWGMKTPSAGADRIEALTIERDEHWKSFVHWRKEADALTEQLEAARADAKEAEAYAEELERDLKTCHMAQAVMDNTVTGLEAKLAKAVEALERAKASIENGGGGGVTDVVWLDDPCPETLCDFIAATIAEIKGEANGQAPHAG